MASATDTTDNTVTITTTADDLRSLTIEANLAYARAHGDSNDMEIEDLRAALESALAILGLDIPDLDEDEALALIGE